MDETILISRPHNHAHDVLALRGAAQ